MKFPSFGKEPEETPTEKLEPQALPRNILHPERPTAIYNTRIIGHASSDPLRITTEGKLDVITQFSSEDANMQLLTNLENLPKCVKDFIDRLQPNTIVLFDKNGVVHIEVSLSILRSLNCFQAFLSFYHTLLSEFPQLTPYVELYEATEQAIIQAILSTNPKKYDKPMPIWLTRHFYVVIHVQTMILDKLRLTLSAKDETFDIAASVDYLSKHGLSDDELQKTLGVTERTIYRYKAKLEKKGTDKLSQSGQTADLADSKACFS